LELKILPSFWCPSQKFRPLLKLCICCDLCCFMQHIVKKYVGEIFWCIWSSEEVSVHSWRLCLSQLSGIWLCVVFIDVVYSQSSLFCVWLMQTAWGVGGQSRAVSSHNSCCLTSTLLDRHFLVFFEGHISLEEVGGRYHEWLRLNLISCLKFLVYLGSFWHSWSGSYVVHSSSLVLSKFNWCCATTKLAHIVHVLASWLQAASHLSHADCDTFTGYNLLSSDQDHLSVVSSGSHSF